MLESEKKSFIEIKAVLNTLSNHLLFLSFPDCPSRKSLSRCNNCFHNMHAYSDVA